MKTNQLQIGDVVTIPARGNVKRLYTGNNNWNQLFFSLSNNPLSRTIWQWLRTTYERATIPDYLLDFQFYSKFSKPIYSFHYCSLLYKIGPWPKRRKTKKTIIT